MAGANPRALAAWVLVRVLEDGRYLDTALDEALPQAPREARALVQELAYGTLRSYHRLAGIARLFVRRPLKARDRDIEALLLLGLYQLRELRVPDHAAVDQTVEAAAALGKPWAKALLNATLRAALRDEERITAALAGSAELRYSHPGWLIDGLRRDYPEGWERILNANNARPPMTLRVNLARNSRERYMDRLSAAGVGARAHAVESAVVLAEPVPVERLPGFAEGLVSVQDAGAQLAAIWLDAGPRERVLDACAAPGGKAAHILERSPAELVGLEIDASRLARMRAGLARLGLSAVLIRADAAHVETWWDGRPFDRVLVDAPCSATGVIRRHPDIKVRRKPEHLPRLLQTQAALLDGVWPCLRPGGKLLYSTCSVLSEENEQQVRGFLDRHPEAEVLTPEATSGHFGRQILPGEDDMDGFYYASLRKR